MSEAQVTGLGPGGVKEWSGERRRWLPKLGDTEDHCFHNGQCYWVLTMCQACSAICIFSQ